MAALSYLLLSSQLKMAFEFSSIEMSIWPRAKQSADGLLPTSTRAGASTEQCTRDARRGARLHEHIFNLSGPSEAREHHTHSNK